MWIEREGQKLRCVSFKDYLSLEFDIFKNVSNTFNLKDKVDSFDKSGIYEIKCNYCHPKYYGLLELDLNLI